MPRDNDKEYNDLEQELDKTKAAIKAAKKNADSNEDLEEIAETEKKVNKIKSREIRGMSESTGHALLEELRAMRAEMADKFGVSNVTATPDPTPENKEGKDKDEAKPESSGFSLSSLFFD